MDKKNLRNHPLAYQVVIVNGETNPNHPMIHKLREFIETRIAQNMPECVFGPNLFEYGFVWGWYFILLDPLTTNTDPAIVGYAHVHADDEKNEVEVRHFCTNTQAYKGGGTSLMQEIMKFTRQNGYNAIHLESLWTAVPFYEKMGFQKEYTGDCTNLCPMRFNIRRGGTRKGNRRRQKRTRSK